MLLYFREELVMHIMSQPATPSKGPTSSYIDWAVLGHVLERTTGKPFQQLVQEEVFTMLGTAAFMKMVSKGSVSFFLIFFV